MSIRLMSAIWQHSPAKGTALLLLLSIADHCNDQGVAWPGVESLARKCRMSPRNVRYLLRQLETKGLLVTERRDGRTHLFRIPYPKGGKPTAPLQPTAGGKPTAPRGEGHCKGGGKPTSAESSLNHQGTITTSRGTESDQPPKQRAKRKRKTDPRRNHPAIQAVRDVTNRYPAKALWDDIIKLLGDEPRIDEVRLCFKEWVRRGFNPTNLAWLDEWFVSGIPPRRVSQTSVQDQTADVIRRYRERHNIGATDAD